MKQAVAAGILVAVLTCALPGASMAEGTPPPKPEGTAGAKLDLSAVKICVDAVLSGKNATPEQFAASYTFGEARGKTQFLVSKEAFVPVVLGLNADELGCTFMTETGTQAHAMITRGFFAAFDALSEGRWRDSRVEKDGKIPDKAHQFADPKSGKTVRLFSKELGPSLILNISAEGPYWR